MKQLIKLKQIQSARFESKVWSQSDFLCSILLWNTKAPMKYKSSVAEQPINYHLIIDFGDDTS